jgi:hypothetical protein
VSVDPADDFVIERTAAGWPARAVVVTRTGRDDSEAHFARTGVMTTGVGPAAVVWSGWSASAAWSGLLVDSVLLALPWLGIISIPALRRVWRRRHGLCQACSYDLRGQDGDDCPECGATIAAGSR